MTIRLFLLLQLFCFSAATCQTFYTEATDGQVYVKFTAAALKPVDRTDPRHLKALQFGMLTELAGKYGITRLELPFWQASDDAFLRNVVKIHFLNFEKVDALLAELRDLPGIELADKVPYCRTFATPNDFAITSSSVHLSQINAQNAWNVFSGNSNITVAIVDDAVFWSHADLVQNTYTNTAEIPNNNTDDDNNGYIDDVNGYDVADNDNNAQPTGTQVPGWAHGTHCAGDAAARTDNAIGISSIGWNIKIIPVKAASVANFNISHGYEGIIYAAKARARIISLSWGHTFGYNAFEQAVINFAWNKGCIIIAAAGNNNNGTLVHPAAYNNVYAVAAVDPSDVKWNLSSFGSYIDISAPGNNIMGTQPYTGSPAYQALSGTSFAAPMTAGLAGLMLSKSPFMTQTDVLNCISSTAVNIYTLSGNSSFSGGLGAGRIEAYQAMICAATFSTMPPIANFFAFPLNTCPNTPVAFTDSSYYGPTTWNWSFQGGSPSTSTLQNPVVQWSTPGTFSVSLTVTNSFGSHTKTKLSYITVAGPVALPLQEGFQSPQFLPPNWTPNNIDYDQTYWERVTGVGGFGTSTACARFDNYNYYAGSARDEMRTPKYDFSGVVSAQIHFDVAYARYNAQYSDTLEVKVSTNCGVSWNSIYLKGGSTLSTASDVTSQFTPTSTQWRTEFVNITSLTAGQGNVMFSFINRGGFGQPIYLDNINLLFPNPTLTVSGPSVTCVGATYSVTNTSTNSAGYSWLMPGGTPSTSTSTNIAVSYASPGTYSITLTGVNGTASVSVTKTVNVVTQLPVSITPSTVTICPGGSVTLSASGGTSYSWAGAGSSNSIVVSPANTNTYTVTGSLGTCSGSAAAVVSVTPINVQIVSAYTTVCKGGTLALQASGASTYSWSFPPSTATSVIVAPTVSTMYVLNGFIGGCQGSATIMVSVYLTPPLSTISTTVAACANLCNGAAGAVTSNGIPPYTYSVQGVSGCSAMPCNSLCAGQYTLLTVDSKNCTVKDVFSIGSLAPVAANTSFTNASCAACPNGVLSVTATGGTAPYTYTWLPAGGNGATTSGVLPGCYTVVINDAQGCSTQSAQCVSLDVGVSESEHEIIRIYPVPARGELHISGRFTSYRLVNSIGQIMAEGENANGEVMIGCHSFARGLYFVQMGTPLGHRVEKVILE
jgi:serine protease